MSYPLTGGCACGRVRYRVETEPMIVHACHCRWCQRESGSAFAQNAMIEADRVTHTGDEPELVMTPSESGKGQLIARCPACKVAVWSNYGGTGPLTRFVRVGTLDTPDAMPPDVHIFTESKQAWLVLPEGTPVFETFYSRSKTWTPDSLARLAALKPAIEAWRGTQG